MAVLDKFRINNTTYDLKDTVSGYTTNVGTVTGASVNGSSVSPDSNGIITLPNYPTSLPASDTTNTYNSTGTAPVSGTAVASALGTLDVTGASNIAASKTISAWSETDGKVSISTQNISITKSQISDFPTLGTAAGMDYTTSVSSGSSDLVTSGAVYTAIDNLPEPMVFKGSLGTGGTITALPVDGSASIGDTYKVITDGTYASKAAKVGDTFICLTKTSSANTWELIPSGDEPSGTVTSVGISNGGGLSVSGSPITSSGTITISHSDTSSQASVSNSGRTYIQSITLDTYGHVTALSSATETVTNTDRYVNSAAFAHDSTNDNVKMTLTRAGSDTATVTANIPKVSSSSAGVVPKGATVSSQSQTTKFLREDGTWAAPSYTTSLAWGSVTGKPDSYTPSSHTHGNIQNGGTLQTTDITIASGDKLIVTDSSDSSKIARTSIAFDGSTATKALTQKGTWESFTNNSGTVTSVNATGATNTGISVTGGAITTSGTLTINLNLSDAINGLLTEGSSNAQRDDYIIAQYAGGGTTTKTYHRRKLSNIFAALNSSDITTALGYTPPTTDTKNTAGSTDTSSKIYLIGATSQATNPQTYSDDQVTVTSGVLSTNGHTSTGNIVLSSSSGDSPQLQFLRGSSLTKWRMYVSSGQLKFDSSTDGSTWTNRAYFGDGSGALTLSSVTASTLSASTNITATGNVTGAYIGVSGTSGTSGGISLYNGAGNVDNYGIAFRKTSNWSTHGYVSSDWATYFTMSNTDNRGWIFKRSGSINVASIDTSGNAVLNGSLTVGGNSANTSGVRQVYNSTTQSLDFVFVA